MHEVRRCCLRLRLSSQNQGAKRNSTKSKSVQVCSWSTPLKTNGWNLTNQPIEKGKSSSIHLRFGVQNVNLPGCISRFQKCFSWHPQPSVWSVGASTKLSMPKHPMESPSDSTSLKSQSPPTFNFSPLQTHQPTHNPPNHPHPLSPSHPPRLPTIHLSHGLLLFLRFDLLFQFLGLAEGTKRGRRPRNRLIFDDVFCVWDKKERKKSKKKAAFFVVGVYWFKGKLYNIHNLHNLYKYIIVYQQDQENWVGKKTHNLFVPHFPKNITTSFSSFRLLALIAGETICLLLGQNS